MCPFCIGTAAWAAAGIVSAGGLGVLAAVVRGQPTADALGGDGADGRRDPPKERSGSE